MPQTKAFLTICAIFLLIGCATTTPENIPSQAVSNQKTGVDLVSDENTAVLSIARFGTTGYALKARVLVDGEEVGRIKNNQYVSLPIGAGSHEIELKFSALSFQKGDAFTLDAEAGQTYAYRITSSISGTVGGAYGNNLSTKFRFVPTSASVVNSCCELLSAP